MHASFPPAPRGRSRDRSDRREPVLDARRRAAGAAGGHAGQRAGLPCRGAGSARLRDRGDRTEPDRPRSARALRSGPAAGAAGDRTARPCGQLHPGAAQRGDACRPAAQQRHADPGLSVVRHPRAAGTGGRAGGDGPASPLRGGAAGRRRAGQGGLLRPGIRRRRARSRPRGAVVARALRDAGQRPLCHRPGPAAGRNPAAGGDQPRRRPPARPRAAARRPCGAPQHAARPPRGAAGTRPCLPCRGPL